MSGIYELLWSHLEIVEQCKYSNIENYSMNLCWHGLCHDFYFMPWPTTTKNVCYCCYTYFLSRFFSLSQTEENKQLYLNFNPRMQALHHMHRNLHILEKKYIYIVEICFIHINIHIIYILVLLYLLGWLLLFIHCIVYAWSLINEQVKGTRVYAKHVTAQNFINIMQKLYSNEIRERKIVQVLTYFFILYKYICIVWLLFFL